MRLKSLLVAILLLNSCAIVVYSQPVEKRHSISIAAEALSLKDVSVLGTSVTGTGGGLNYSYTRNSWNRNFVVSAGWTNALFTQGDSRLELNGFSVTLSDGFLINRRRHSSFKAYLGYSIDAHPSFIKLQNKTAEKYSWSTVNSLNLYQACIYEHHRNIFSFSVHIPVIGFSSRPDNNTRYPGDINGVLYNSYSNLSLTSFRNYKAVKLDLNFEHRINARWNFKAGLNYRYSDLETTLPVQLQSGGIQAGLSLKID